jgi:NADPH:quinone reductase-like Zn-dependent oxidoreductase
MVIGQIPSASCNYSKNHSAVKGNGAAIVLAEEPLQSISSLAGAKVHGILDTVGGKAIWKASRAVLQNGGQVSSCGAHVLLL